MTINDWVDEWATRLLPEQWEALPPEGPGDTWGVVLKDDHGTVVAGAIHEEAARHIARAHNSLLFINTHQGKEIDAALSDTEPPAD